MAHAVLRERGEAETTLHQDLQEPALLRLQAFPCQGNSAREHTEKGDMFDL